MKQANVTIEDFVFKGGLIFDKMIGIGFWLRPLARPALNILKKIQLRKYLTDRTPIILQNSQ